MAWIDSLDLGRGLLDVGQAGGAPAVAAGESRVDGFDARSEVTVNPLEYIGSSGPASRVVLAHFCENLSDALSVVGVAVGPVVFIKFSINLKVLNIT